MSLILRIFEYHPIKFHDWKANGSGAPIMVISITYYLELRGAKTTLNMAFSVTCYLDSKRVIYFYY